MTLEHGIAGQDAEPAPPPLTRFGWAFRRPLRNLLLYVVVAAVLVFAQTWQHLAEIKQATALEAAQAYSEAITTIRNFYSSEIVPRARRAGVEVTYDYHGKEAAIPFPATLSIDLGEAFERRGNGAEYRLYSEHPFPWRADRPVDRFEREALAALVANPGEPFVRFETTGGGKAVRYATAVVMRESCVACHNSYPESPKKTWAVGDVRGAQMVTIPMPDTAALGYRSTAIAVGVVGVGLLFIWLLLAQLDRSLRETRAAAFDAQQASLAKSEFLAKMSHELRTPLNAIIGFSGLMKGSLPGPMPAKRYREYAADIHDSGVHLLDLVNDILDLTRIESGAPLPDRESVDVGGTIEAVRLLLGQSAQARGIQLVLDLPESLPGLRIGRRRFKQILVNLLSNGIRFTPPGGRVTLAARCDPERGHRFQVIDSGIGMSAADIPYALSVFGQVNRHAAQASEGIGIGLPLAKALAEAYGGTLELESEPGAGTTATVRFPADRIVGD